MNMTRDDILQYLVKLGEKALDEASRANITSTMNEVLEEHMYELLALKYHDALRSFESALDIDPTNESALEGFCYSLAQAISHYERSGMSHVADIIKVKAMQYRTENILDIASRSKRIGRYLFEILKEVFP